MSVRELVARIAATPDCRVTTPFKRSDLQLPALHEGHVLPDDLREFYEMCGGLSLYKRSPCSMIIVPPTEVVLANIVLFPGLRPEQLTSSFDDISWAWYLLAQNDIGEYLSVDLIPERLGRFSYSFLRSHPMT